MMLKNVRFAFKIALLPTLAGIAFVVILAISWITGNNGAKLLTNIETGYYSSLEMGRKLEENLEVIRRSFEDAASLADPDYLAEAEAIRAAFLEHLQSGYANPVVDPAPLDEIERQFGDYFEQAYKSTQHLIDGTGDDDIYDGLQKIAAQYQALKSEVQALQIRDQADVATAFANAQSSQRTATAVLVVVVVLSLVLLITTSIFIIRMASKSIQTTVKGINALAAGDLSREFQPDFSDEMGQMVNRVGHVTLTINDLTTEVQTLIDAVKAGKLQTRGESERFDGAYAQLIENINVLIDAFVAPIEVTANYVERISQGDIPPPITETYHGDFNQTKENLNVLVSAMTGLVQQTNTLTSAAKAGDLDKRGDVSQFSGVWREQVEGINETLDAVTQPLQEVSEVMSAIANGDLTRTIDTHYKGAFAKLQTDINTTIARLTDVISSIKGAGDAVSVASRDIASGNQSLRTRTDDQASSLKETADSMQDMISSVRENAENAHRANETVLKASDKAKQGGSVVGDAVRAMDAINASSRKIADIINVIDEIAFQTNLLALNAAVEAARAGEEGRGFAVVASEVRNLAGRSAMAAKEINELIKDSVGKVKQGSRLVHESGQTLEEIVSAVMDVTDIVSKIAKSSQEQTINIEGVNEAIAAMDTMTKKNAALAVEAARSSDVMGQEAERLTSTTSFFTMESGQQKPDQTKNPEPASKTNGSAKPFKGANPSDLLLAGRA